MQSFLVNFVRVLIDAVDADIPDNYDFDRFAPQKISRSSRVGWRRYCLNVLGLDLCRAVANATAEAKSVVERGMSLVQEHLDDLEWLYNALNDDESRRWLVSLMAYRALGHSRIRLATSTPAYWSGVDRLRSLGADHDVIDLGFQGWVASQIDLSELGLPIRLYSTPAAAYAQFVMKSYRCESAQDVIEAMPGDVVLDCGGCYGDTALYLAHLVGAEGKVFSFEFEPNNLKVWKKNIGMNPDIQGRIQLVPLPVYQTSGQLFFVDGQGPGTHYVKEAVPTNPIGFKTISIDDFVSQQSLSSIDFIKMDIEGSEVAALIGAEETIRRFAPSLAICVYHRLEDFWMVPKYLRSLNSEYRLYLRHFSIHAEESVVFAIAR